MRNPIPDAGSETKVARLSVELAGIHPTRQELLRLRRRKSLAEGIIDILKKDLDALIVTLFDFIKGVSSTRDRIDEALGRAYRLFVEAQMIAGSKKIEETSKVVCPIRFDIAVTAKKGVLGLSFPSFELVREAGEDGPRFSLLDTPASLDQSAMQAADGFVHIVKLVETEASIREILDVIAVKKRQVNRIEYKILPQLDAAIRYIELIIEEAERQDATRVRVLQRKRKERASKEVSDQRPQNGSSQQP